MMEKIPSYQTALQLVGPDQLILNHQKPIGSLGSYHILAKVNAVGLCFSDLKLLKQFDSHARKGPVLSGMDPAILAEHPAYVPDKKPAVPGHEACVTIVAVGDKVRRHTVGQRALVQTDYRWLRTAGANAAFGYNFEGALQQYVVMDERMIIEPDSNESFLIPVPDHISHSAVALVEPWACVECSYVSRERQTIKKNGRMLVVSDNPAASIEKIAFCYDPAGKPAEIWTFGLTENQQKHLLPAKKITDLAALPNEYFDDILYFGCQKNVIELLNDKLAAEGIINIVLGGKSIGQPVSVGVGRVHYGLTRWIGTASSDPSDSYGHIPQTGELKDGDRILVIGAAGPMGQMHIIRQICSGFKNLEIVGTDFDDHRLQGLSQKAAPLARQRQVGLALLNPQKQQTAGAFSYFAIMAPVASLVAQVIQDSAPGARINIFAGIPAPVKQELDLDRYIRQRCFIFGTSGSRLSDMKIVLDKVIRGQLDVNISVDAVSGMAGATEGIRAVENRTLAGKIIVYPDLLDMPLTPLDKLPPQIKHKLADGWWTKQAEQALLNRSA